MTDDLSGHIETTGLIGTPVAHSLSPAMHNAAAAALGIPWVYRSVECPDEDAASSVIESCRRCALFVGMNITMPYKELAYRLSDEADASAMRAKGANVLSCADGRIVALNTDGAGIVGALSWQAGISAEGRRCLVCGTGPAARSAILALLDAGAASVAVASRELSRADALRDALCDARVHPADYGTVLPVMEKAEVIIDATSVGMHEGDISVLPAQGFHSGQVLIDVVYAHGVTDIVAKARSRGALAFDGLGMLVEQAVLTARIWLRDQGIERTVDLRQIMHQAALDELARR